jgi:hypothetical protein
MKVDTADLKLLQEKGISEATLKNQIETFKTGVPFVNIVAYAKIGEGIHKIDDDKKEEFVNFYNSAKLKVVKFTPASGAATRMFKAVHSFFNSVSIQEDDINEALTKKEFKLVKNLLDGIEDLAFYNEALKHAEKLYSNFGNYSKIEQKALILKAAIDKDGLNLGDLPKGLIPFHEYENKSYTPFQEHLDEALNYASKNGKAFLNFSISEDHEEKFKAELENHLKNGTSGIEYVVDFSFQKPSTDTIAVNPDNTPYRTKEGHLMFRPGGHGALIHNLNQIDADLIFIKNIDNVSKRARDKKDTMLYKKVLAGLLLSIQNKVFDFQKKLASLTDVKLIEECRQFMMESLNVKNPKHTSKELIEELRKPIRVCGMVKNDGEPGGGPFWIEDNGHTSLQIIETSQIDTSKKDQKQLLEHATHFNPVDIVCGVKDYEGKKFDLEKHINPKRGFIANKSVEGNEIKALELPGLWNGAMEFWHSIFVEVPVSTFNPVKTVADLLKPAHQEK